MTQALTPDADTAARYLRARKGVVTDAVAQYIDAEEFLAEHVDANILDPDPLEDLYRASCPHANLKYVTSGDPSCVVVTLSHMVRVCSSSILLLAGL